MLADASFGSWGGGGGYGGIRGFLMNFYIIIPSLCLHYLTLINCLVEYTVNLMYK
jgi:hypothetical protein